MYEIMTSDEAIRLIRDGDCICVNSFVGIENPVELHEALYRRYQRMQSPNHLTIVSSAGNYRQMIRGLHSLISAVQGLVEFHRILNAHKRIHTDTVTVSDQADGLIRSHDFVHSNFPPKPKTKHEIILSEQAFCVQSINQLSIPFRKCMVQSDYLF